MATSENVIEMSNRLKSIKSSDNPEVDHIIAGTDDIYDDTKEKKQSQINTETYSLVNDINERLSGLSPDQQSALSVAAKATNNEIKLGYYVCGTEGNAAAKVINNATGYVLSTGGSIKVKMTNANTANNATLNINSTGAKPLYYDGVRASANNTWEAGETVEVYYDGTNFYANNVAGGGGDGAFDVSEKYPTSGVEGGNTYTLQGALTVLNANLPASKKKGGMSIKFVQSSDNKYVQYFLTKNTWSTNVADWSEVDDDGSYDISAKHNDASYDNLSNALGTNGANVPVSVRKGGMIVKYIENISAKYKVVRTEYYAPTVEEQAIINAATAISGELQVWDGTFVLDTIMYSYNSEDKTTIQAAIEALEVGSSLSYTATTRTNNYYTDHPTVWNITKVAAEKNEYVSHRYLLDSYTNDTAGNKAFLNILNWSSVDNTPMPFSTNAVRSDYLFEKDQKGSTAVRGVLNYTTKIIDPDDEFITSDFIPIKSGTNRMLVLMIIQNSQKVASKATVLVYDGNKSFVNNYHADFNGLTRDIADNVAYFRVSYHQSTDFVGFYVTNRGTPFYRNITIDDMKVVFKNPKLSMVYLPYVTYDVYKEDGKAYVWNVSSRTLQEQNDGSARYVRVKVRKGDIVVCFRYLLYANGNYTTVPFLKLCDDGSIVPYNYGAGSLLCKATEDVTLIIYERKGGPCNCYVYTDDASYYYNSGNDKTWFEKSIVISEVSGDTGKTIYTNIPKGQAIKAKIELISGTANGYGVLIENRLFDLNVYGSPFILTDTLNKIVLTARDGVSLTAKITIRCTMPNFPLTENGLLLDDNLRVINNFNTRPTTKRLQFVHMSDPHGVIVLTEKIKGFIDESPADFSIITGDLTTGDYGPFYADYLLTWQKPCFIVLGNHDIKDSPSLQARYEKYIEPLNIHNGISDNTKTYYSVDYTNKGIKCIILDQWDGVDAYADVASTFKDFMMSDEQVTWFINELEDALNNNLDVAIFSHMAPASDRIIRPVDGWSDTTCTKWGNYGEFLNILVDAFMKVNGSSYDVVNPHTGTSFTGHFGQPNRYGQFVGWFVGHLHYGLYGYPEKYDRQFYAYIGRPTANMYYDDMDARLNTNVLYEGGESINYVTVDTINKIVSFIRIGGKETVYGVEAKTFSINYGNHRILDGDYYPIPVV